MQRLSELVRQFHEDPDAVRDGLRPALFLWLQAPVTETKELLWQTMPRFQIGSAPHDPAVFPIRKRSGGAPNAFALGITLGRASNNDLAIDHASVSRFHAYMQLELSGQYQLFDADSANGTLCDGRAVPKGMGTMLRDGSQVALGDVTLHFYTPATFEAVYLSGPPRPAPR